MSESNEIEILLVEDNPDDLDMALRSLRKANLTNQIQTVRDDAEALEFIFCQGALGNVVDVGLIAYPVKDPRLIIVPMRQEPLVLICSPDHPFARLKSIKLKALNGQKLISFDPDTPMRKALDKIFKEHDVHVHHSMEFDSVETVKRAVEINAGIAMVPISTVTLEIERQSLALVEISDGRFFRPTAAICKMRRVLSPALKQFLETLKDGSELGAGDGNG